MGFIEDCSTSRVEMRRATICDALTLYHWRNSETVLRYFKNPRKNSKLKHIFWYFRYLYIGHAGKMYFFSEDNVRFGMTRLDYTLDTGALEVSILVAPDYQGKGLGSFFLQSTLKVATEEFGAARVIARINRMNRPSIKLFLRLGFVQFKSDDFYDYFSFTLDKKSRTAPLIF